MSIVWRCRKCGKSEVQRFNHLGVAVDTVCYHEPDRTGPDEVTGTCDDCARGPFPKVCEVCGSDRSDVVVRSDSRRLCWSCYSIASSPSASWLGVPLIYEGTGKNGKQLG